MEDEGNAKIGGRRQREKRLRLERAGPLLGLLIALALLASVCSGGSPSPGVANVSATSTTGSSSTSGSGTKASALSYSQCMRSHGVSDFPDPNANGSIQISGGPGSDLDPNNPTFQAAQRTCQSLQPKPSAAQQHQAQQQFLKYSQCMRSHGIKDFPDPNANGRISISAGPGSDLDPNNPTFQAAQSACQHYLPGGKAPSIPPGGGSGRTSSGGSSGQVIG